MGYIYKVTNIQNNKIYIGQTTYSVKERWNKHLSEARNNLDKKTHFKNAIRYWGENNFLVETIEECPNEKLDSRECFWIAYYDSYKGWGYNSTYGGEGTLLYDRETMFELWKKGLNLNEISERLGCHSKTVSAGLQSLKISHNEILKRGFKTASEKNCRIILQYDSNGQLLNEYKSADEVVKNFDINVSTVRGACRGKWYAKGYYWKYKDNPQNILDLIEEYKETRYNDRKRPIDQYSENGEYLKTWSSMVSAAEYYKCTISNIYRSCNKYFESACGYLWTYSDQEEDMIKRCKDYRKKIDPRGFPIKQYDLKGNFINQYNSIAEAARILNIDRTAIHKAYQNKYTSNGYIWIMPGEEDWIEKIIQRHNQKHDTKKKIVYQYTLDGQYLNSYPSATDACIAMGINPQKKRSLSRNCQGYQKTFNGYIWSYEKT